MKTCSKCGETKSLSAFGKRPAGRGGLEAHCRECARIRNRNKMRARLACNREKVYAQRRKYDQQRRQRDPVGYRATRDRENARERARRNANHALVREKERARNRRQREARPEVYRAQIQRRIARKHGAPGRGVTAADWRDSLIASLGLCAYCCRPAKLTMDHIEPLSRGGAHDPENVVAACDRCNKSKNDLPLVVWLAKRTAAA